jgi:hypothetical protein
VRVRRSGREGKGKEEDYSLGPRCEAARARVF